MDRAARRKLRRGKNDLSVILALFSFAVDTPGFSTKVFHLLSNQQVVWRIGLILGVGNMLGAWVAVERGAAFVRWVLIAVVAVSGAKLLGAFDWVGGLF